METIEITKQSKSYEQIDNLVIIVAALATSFDYRSNGHAIYNHGDFIIVEGKATNKMIRFPLYGPIELALKNRKPESINLTIQDFAPSPHKYDNTIIVLKKTMDFLFPPYLLDFYERYKGDAIKKFGEIKTKLDSWSESWQMAWVVRNAIAHNHKIYFRNDKDTPRTWSGITISPDDNEKPLSEFINFADIIILMLEMEKDLS